MGPLHQTYSTPPSVQRWQRSSDSVRMQRMWHPDIFSNLLKQTPMKCFWYAFHTNGAFHRLPDKMCWLGLAFRCLQQLWKYDECNLFKCISNEGVWQVAAVFGATVPSALMELRQGVSWLPKRLSSALLLSCRVRERVVGHVAGIGSCKHRLTVSGFIWNRSSCREQRDACHNGAEGSRVPPPHPVPLNSTPTVNTFKSGGSACKSAHSCSHQWTCKIGRLLKKISSSGSCHKALKVNEWRCNYCLEDLLLLFTDDWLGINSLHSVLTTQLGFALQLSLHVTPH